MPRRVVGVVLNIVLAAAGSAAIVLAGYLLADYLP